MRPALTFNFFENKVSGDAEFSEWIRIKMTTNIIVCEY